MLYTQSSYKYVISRILQRCLVISCDVRVGHVFLMVSSVDAKCVTRSYFCPHRAFLIQMSLSHTQTRTHFITADQTHSPTSAPNEVGRFSLHALIATLESFNGITQRNWLLNTICCWFLPLISLSHSLFSFIFLYLIFFGPLGSRFSAFWRYTANKSLAINCCHVCFCSEVL